MALPVMEFQDQGFKLEMYKNQHTQRKLSNYRIGPISLQKVFKVCIPGHETP